MMKGRLQYDLSHLIYRYRPNDKNVKPSIANA
jgi:hypothetical protein